MSSDQLLRLSRGDGPAAIDRCLVALRAGGLVVVPTETVYGVGILPRHGAGLRTLKPDARRPYSLAVDDLSRLADVLAPLSRPARRLAEQCWPGPLTLVLSDRKSGTLGVRLPQHPWLRQLLVALGEPLLLSSANLAGEPAPTSFAQLSQSVRDAADVLVDGGAIPGGVASTVVAAGLAGLRILRQGALSHADLVAQGPGLVAVLCTGNTCRSPMARQLLVRELDALESGNSGVLLPRVASAGLAACPGQPASAGALAAMTSRNIDLSSHRASLLESEILARADVLLGMTRSHVNSLGALAAPDQVVDLFDPEGQEVPDPFGGPPALYEICARHLEQAARSRALSLLPPKEPSQ